MRNAMQHNQVLGRLGASYMKLRPGDLHLQTVNRARTSQSTALLADRPHESFNYARSCIRANVYVALSREFDPAIGQIWRVVVKIRDMLVAPMKKDRH